MYVCIYIYIHVYVFIYIYTQILVMTLGDSDFSCHFGDVQVLGSIGLLVLIRKMISLQVQTLTGNDHTYPTKREVRKIMDSKSVKMGKEYELVPKKVAFDFLTFQMYVWWFFVWISQYPNTLFPFICVRSSCCKISSFFVPKSCQLKLPGDHVIVHLEMKGGLPERLWWEKYDSPNATWKSGRMQEGDDTTKKKGLWRRDYCYPLFF